MRSVSVAVFFCVCFLALVNAAPQFSQPIIPIVQMSDVRDEAGQFSLGYTTGDGTNFQEQGVLKRNVEGTDNVLIKQGRFSYTSPEGQQIQVSYTADENGFHPESPSIPVAPTV